VVGPTTAGRSRPYGVITPAGGDTSAPLNRKKRLSLIARFTSLQGKRVLDAGCGAGGYIAPLLALGADVRGIEWDASKVARFGLENPREAGRVVQGDLAHMPYPSGSFDVVILNEVLEHVPDDAAACREVGRVLGTNGVAIIFSPNRLYPFETHGVILRRSGRPLPFSVPFIPYVPLSPGRHLFIYSARNYFPGELRRLVHGAGFDILHTGYVWQTFENISNRQPMMIRALRPLLRGIASALERVPLVRMLGVSQVVVARRG